MESLMFDAVVSGDSANGPGTLTSAGVLSLYIEDETTTKITPKASPRPTTRRSWPRLRRGAATTA